MRLRTGVARQTGALLQHFVADVTNIDASVRLALRRKVLRCVYICCGAVGGATQIPRHVWHPKVYERFHKILYLVHVPGPVTTQ